MPHCDI